MPDGGRSGQPALARRHQEIRASGRERPLIGRNARWHHWLSVCRYVAASSRQSIHCAAMPTVLARAESSTARQGRHQLPPTAANCCQTAAHLLRAAVTCQVHRTSDGLQPNSNASRACAVRCRVQERGQNCGVRWLLVTSAQERIEQCTFDVPRQDFLPLWPPGCSPRFQARGLRASAPAPAIETCPAAAPS